MAWYYGTYSCGHEGRVNIIGPHKDREWKKENAFSKMCPDCYQDHLKKQRELEKIEAEEKAKELGLPELQGTPKQVAWANTIRQNILTSLEEFAENEGKINSFNFTYEQSLAKEDMQKIINYIAFNCIKANWFIDRRRDSVPSIINEVIGEALKTEEEKIAEEAEKELEEQAKIEATVFPENPASNAVAEISITKDKVSVTFEKNEDFRTLVKSLGYSWSNRHWEKEITETTGSAEDRAAELGNKLLNEGFAIRIFDESIREKAVNGNYTPEHTRWIYRRTSGTYKDWFVIKWEGRDNNLYEKARSLPNSRWNSGVVVKSDYYVEVEDFAKLYGFKFTKGAKELLESAKKIHEEAIRVSPKKVEEKEEKDGLEEILKSDNDILPDLLEEE